MVGKLRKAALGVAVSGSMFAGTASAAVSPYAVDAATLQLYHLDGNATNAVSGGVNLTAQYGASLAAASYNAAFGSGAGPFVNAGATNGSYLGVGARADTLFGTDNVSIALQNPSTRAFTFDAVVKLNTLSGTTAMHLISGEGEGNVGTGDRTFQFRLLPVGLTVGTSDNTRVRVEFNNLAAGGVGQIIVPLPNAGANAVNTTDFFHLALTYSGSAATPGNASFYFTKVANDVTAASLLATGQINEGIAINNNGATDGKTNTDFAIGNELRTTSGEALMGQIDEVRISSVARTADQFIFSASEVPEPTSLAAFTAVGGMLLRRRRSR